MIPLHDENLLNYVKKYKVPKKQKKLEDKHIIFPVYNIQKKEEIVNKNKPNIKLKKIHKKNRCASVDKTNLKFTKNTNKINYQNSSKDIFLEHLIDDKIENKIDKNEEIINNFINYDNEIKPKKKHKKKNKKDNIDNIQDIDTKEIKGIKEKKEKSAKKKKIDYDKLIDELQDKNISLKRGILKTDELINKYKKKCESQEQILRDLEVIFNEMNNNHENVINLNDYESINSLNNNFNDEFLFDEGFQEDFAIKEVEQKIIDDICPNPDAMTYEQLLQLEDKLGNVNKGLSSNQIDELPKTKYKKHKHEENYQCIICMEEFKEREIVNLLPCGHIFHINCIKQWLLKEKTCPFCKYEIR